MRTNSILQGHGSVHSGSVSQGADVQSMTSCMLTSFPAGLPHDTWTAKSAHSHFVGSKVLACLPVTCHLHFWQNDWGLLCATVGTQEWNRYLNKSQRSGEESCPAAPEGD